MSVFIFLGPDTLYETTPLCRKIKGAPIVLVVVLVVVLDKILIPEDKNEDEKYQIRSPESVLI